jgi:hypothetical protein
VADGRKCAAKELHPIPTVWLDVVGDGRYATAHLTEWHLYQLRHPPVFPLPGVV